VFYKHIITKVNKSIEGSYFLGKEFLLLPELQDCQLLFKKAAAAVAFYGDTKKQAGEMLKILPALPPFQRLMKLLEIFGLLSHSSEYELLNAKPLENISDFKEQQRLQKIHRMVEEKFPGKIHIE